MPADYRYPNEQLILGLTLGFVLAVIAISATATLCGSLFFVALMLAFAYVQNIAHHDALVRRAEAVTPETRPGLAALARGDAAVLGVRDIRVFIASAPVLNAYTFGLSDPKAVVLYSGLLHVMDEDEVRFILGHELGHVRLGHTWLNSLVGGMAGIPSPFAAAVILYFAFRWWNRACEFSADRAGLLLTGKPEKAVSALVKLATRGQARSAQAQQRALQQLDAQDEDLGHLVGEMVSTHPLLVRRIEAIRAYAGTAEYQRLRGLAARAVRG
jgi:Zn-dependent protease with chaperone function